MKFIVTLLSYIKQRYYKYRYLNTKNTKTEIKFGIKGKYLNPKTLEPIKCPFCNNLNHIYFTTTNQIYIEHIVLEYDKTCTKCSKVIGHWAHGNWFL